MEYCIVSTRGLDAQRRIERKVCELMQESWTPQGGIFCVVNGGVVLRYMQAMVRAERPAQRVQITGWEDAELLPFYEGEP